MESVLIVGFTRRTSFALAKYLLSVKKFKVILSDTAVDEEKSQLAGELASLGTVVSRLGDQSPALLTEFKPSMIFLSPGVPPSIPLIKQAQAQNIPILNDIEYFSREFPNRIIAAVTGTDGKTTTATWLHHVVSLQFPAVLGGNVGTPIFEFASPKYEEHIHILELSSFQLECVQKIHFRAALILNIAPDHLDRYPNLDAYAAAKKNIFSNMNSADLALLNADDTYTPFYAEGLNAQIEYFSYADTSAHWSTPGDEILLQGKPFFDSTNFKVLGRHQKQNAMAVSAMALFLGVHEKLIRQGLASFEGVEHRLQYLGEKDGIKFYNDSKATSPQALQVALDAFDGKVILLAGGKSKGVPFESLKPLVGKKTSAVFPFGALHGELTEAWGLKETPPQNLEQAFASAVRRAKAGDIILFSPGGTSYDAFNNYEERGRYFASLIERL